MSGNVKIVQNGIDRTGWLSYRGSLNWNLMRGGRGTCTIPFETAPNDPFFPQVGESLEIFDPVSTRVWAGTINDLDITWLGDLGQKRIIVSGTTLEQLFDVSQADKIQYSSDVSTSALTAPFYCGDVVKDLFARSGVTEVTLGTVDDGPTITDLEVTQISQGFNDLALQAGFVWYVDPLDKKLYFHAPDARAAGISITSRDILFETLEWKQSRSDYRTRQAVQQSAGVVSGVFTERFAATGSQTEFALAEVPTDLMNVIVYPQFPGGHGDYNIGWMHGSNLVSVTPAPDSFQTVIITYIVMGSQAIAVGAGNVGVGEQSLQYTRSRRYTPAGVAEEAAAMTTRYGMLPATVQFQTDKPGIGIARALSVATTHPVGADVLLDGTWLVTEVDATVIPGLEKLAEPFGHFRYTVYLTNVVATAIAPASFTLPEAPAFVMSAGVTNNPLPGETPTSFTVSVIGAAVSVSPDPATGQSVVVNYRGAAVPDSPSFVNTMEQLTMPQRLPTPGDGGAGGGATGSVGEVFQRTLLLKDLTVNNDIADHVPVYHNGAGVRVLGVLRKGIASDLIVRINKNGVELITVTIPSTTIVDVVLDWPLLVGSPGVGIPFWDLEVLSADILASDASADIDGIASLTVEWS